MAAFSSSGDDDSWGGGGGGGDKKGGRGWKENTAKSWRIETGKRKETPSAN